MIDARTIPEEQVARVVYLCARAISCALREAGADDVRLYRDRTPTALSMWAGVNRGNLLALMRLLVSTIHRSDQRSGSKNSRGDVRFEAARYCVSAALLWAKILPAGHVTGGFPLEI